MGRVPKRLQKIELRKADLLRRRKGVKWLIILIAILWIATLVESFVVDESVPWYQSMFHLLLPGVIVLTLLLCINIAVETVAIAQAEKLPTLPIMQSWAKKMGLYSIPGFLILILCFAWVQKAPGSAFGLAGYPAGVSIGCLILSRRYMKLNREPDWPLTCLICGIACIIIFGILSGIAYLLGDSYDGHFALSVWCSPTILFTIICAVRYGNKRKKNPN